MADDKINIDLTATDGVTQVLRRINGELVSSTVICKKTSGAFTSITSDTRTFTSATKESAVAQKALTSSLASTGIALMAVHMAFRFAIQKIKEFTRWVGESVQKFREFEKNMAEVSTILARDAIMGFHTLGIEIERLSVKYGKSANDLAQGMYDILSATFEAAEGLRLLEVATKAAIAGITDVATSVDVFTSILNAWGLEASRAREISDQLFQTVVRGKLRFEELAHSIGYIAPIAANLGVEFKEIAAALSTVTRQGQHVDMATRGLALMIQNIADLTPVAAEAAVRYGVDLSDVALRAGGLEYIITDLNRAMKEHGSHILPEMIRNMRAFRVAVALAGDVGLTGFREDLSRLEEAHGQTDEAMQRMMQTAQQEADILAQNMELIERQVGKAWHGASIWWQKAKVRMGAFFTDEDGGQLIRDYERSINEIAISSRDMLQVSMKLVELKPVQNLLSEVDINEFDTVDEKIRALQESVQKGFEMEKLSEFFEVSHQIEDLGKINAQLDYQRTNLRGLESLLDNMSLSVNEISNTFGLSKWRNIGKTITPQLQEDIERWNEALSDADMEELGLFKMFEDLDMLDDISPAQFRDVMRANLKIVQDSLKDVTDEYSDNERALKRLLESKSTLAEFEEEFTSALVSASRAVEDHKETIVTLRRAIDELKDGVEDTYTTIEGTAFAGRDYWQATTHAMEVSLNRFTRYAEMAIKYGDSMRTDYMGNINDLAQGYENLDHSQLESLQSLNWYNESIFNSIDGIGDFGNSLVNVIKTLGEYNQLVKEAQKIQQEYRSELDESRKKVLELNLQMTQIQLQGMMRRRGLTRSEEKRLMQIRMEQTRERIKQMEMELYQRKKIDDMGLRDLEIHAQNAQAIYQEYVDRVRFHLEDMKDIQDDELNKFLQTIDLKEKRLVDYQELHDTRVGMMEEAMLHYQSLLGLIANDPSLTEHYRKLYGLDVLEEAREAMESYRDFGANYGISSVHNMQTPSFASPSGMLTSIMNSVPRMLRGLLNASPLGRIMQFNRGTYSIPKDGLYHLHRAEQIVPAGGQSAGSDNIVVNITVNAAVEKDYDVTLLAEKLGEAMQAKLLDKRGVSKFRLR